MLLEIYYPLWVRVTCQRVYHGGSSLFLLGHNKGLTGCPVDVRCRGCLVWRMSGVVDVCVVDVAQSIRAVACVFFYHVYSFNLWAQLLIGKELIGPKFVYLKAYPATASFEILLAF